MAGPTDAEILAVGRASAPRSPRASRRPVKALDARAMDLASPDAELRAALFRFVDVVPGLPLARRPRAHLDRLPRRGRRASRRRSRSRCGWANTRAGPRGARAPPRRPASATWRTASSSARRPRTPRACCAACGATASRRRSTCSARRRSPPREADRYAARCAEALRRRSPASTRPLPARPRWSTTPPARCRARTCP